MSQLSHSMHEMYEIRDLDAYTDAMDEMSSPAPDEADDFLLIDDSDRSSSHVGDRPSAASTRRPRPIQPTIGRSSTLRHSMSCVNLPSEAERQKLSLDLLTMVSDVHITAIEEEREEGHNIIRDNALDRSQTKSGTGKDNDLVNSAHRHPSRRVSQGPLRSSLKGSRASFSSNNLSDSSHHLSDSIRSNVSFSKLEIRSYEITLGDTPNLSGPPISLDWKYDPQATQVHDIDAYEQLRSATSDNPTPSNPRRQSMDDLFIQPKHRQYLLMRNSGFSRMQIKKATEEAQRLAKQRQKSAKRPILLDEMREKANNRFRSWQKKKSSR